MSPTPGEVGKGKNTGMWELSCHESTKEVRPIAQVTTTYILARICRRSRLLILAWAHIVYLSYKIPSMHSQRQWHTFDVER